MYFIRKFGGDITVSFFAKWEEEKYDYGRLFCFCKKIGSTLSDDFLFSNRIKNERLY